MKIHYLMHLISFWMILGCNYQKDANLKQNPCDNFTCNHGGIVRGDTTKKELSIVFTGGDFADGSEHIIKVLDSHEVKASFFFTGNFYRNSKFKSLIHQLKNENHYLGAHSDKHLLYCDWTKRDSLLVTKHDFLIDLEANYKEMTRFGIKSENAKLFMPPYEWYNDSISNWTNEAGYQIVNFTSGTRTNADYTTPDMNSYQSSEEIWKSILNYEGKYKIGLNGFIMLIHIGTAPQRTDKFYHRLDDLILWLKKKGYKLKRIDELISIEE
jgi:endoglucanase